VQLTVVDWDKLLSNDHVGDAAIEITVQSTNHMVLYGNNFGPNYSNATTLTTRS